VKRPKIVSGGTEDVRSDDDEDDDDNDNDNDLGRSYRLHALPEQAPFCARRAKRFRQRDAAAADDDDCTDLPA
jgi:hypothetical protein